MPDETGCRRQRRRGNKGEQRTRIRLGASWRGLGRKQREWRERIIDRSSKDDETRPSRPRECEIKETDGTPGQPSNGCRWCQEEAGATRADGDIYYELYHRLRRGWDGCDGCDMTLVAKRGKRCRATNRISPIRKAGCPSAFLRQSAFSVGGRRGACSSLARDLCYAGEMNNASYTRFGFAASVTSCDS